MILVTTHQVMILEAARDLCKSKIKNNLVASRGSVIGRGSRCVCLPGRPHKATQYIKLSSRLCREPGDVVTRIAVCQVARRHYVRLLAGKVAYSCTYCMHVCLKETLLFTQFQYVVQLRRFQLRIKIGFPSTDKSDRKSEVVPTTIQAD